MPGINVFVSSVFIFCLVSLNSFVVSKKKLYYGGLFQIAESSAWNTRGVLPATKMALEHINNSTDILKDYELVQTVQDDQCTAELAVKEFIKFLTSSEKYIALLGPGCSVGAQALSELASAWNIIQLSFGATSALLSDDGRYPLFWRTVTPETTHNPARVSILKHFGWKKVAILRNNLDFTAMLSRAVRKVMEEFNIEVLTEAVYEESPQDTVQLLEKYDARIIMAFIYEENYRKTLCEAYKRGFYGSKYVWINYGFLAPKWWMVDDTDCTVQQIIEAMGNYFSVNLLTISEDPQPTISGYSAPELWTEYRRRLTLSSFYQDWFHDHSGFAYDGVWTLALMLNMSIPLLAKKGLTLEDFSHKDVNSIFPSLFEEALKKMHFIGMSGPVSFDDHGDRETISIVKQLQVDVELEIADYDEKTDSLVFNKGKKFIWPVGGGPPKDGVEEVEILETIQLKLVVVMTALSVGGISLAIWFLVFNIKKRHLRYIKMSSPRLNVLIIIGCILVYLSGILMGLNGGLAQKHSFQIESLCLMEIWVFCSGFTLAFGAMFVKTWRVYTIFSNKKRDKRRVIRDSQLILAVIGLLFLDVVVLSIWRIVDPIFLQRVDLPAKIDPDNTDLKYKPYYQICWSEHAQSFENVILAYKGLFLIYGAVLAFETRNVTIPALNDSKYIGTALYIVIISCVLVIPLKTLLAGQESVKFGLIVGLELSATTAILCSVFLPKVLHLRRDPTGERETNTDFGTQVQQQSILKESKQFPLKSMTQNQSSTTEPKKRTKLRQKNSVHVATYVDTPTKSNMDKSEDSEHFSQAPCTSSQTVPSSVQPLSNTIFVLEKLSAEREATIDLKTEIFESPNTNDLNASTSLQPNSVKGCFNDMSRKEIRKNNFMTSENLEDDFAPLETGFSNLFPALRNQNRDSPQKNTHFTMAIVNDIPVLERKKEEIVTNVDQLS